ncbi:MAG: hybrid sensor histidine kinase/response regulator [Steroidobacteraceae bacterium]
MIATDGPPDPHGGPEGSAAQSAAAHLAAIVQSSNDAIISKTLEGTIRSWNLGAERIFGWAAAEAIGRSITLIIPPDRLEEEQHILDTLKRGERIEHFETTRVAKDGRPIEVSLTVSPMRNAAGVVIGASKIARDITARKHAERLLQEREEALRLADQRKDEFLALLGHELRNPLAPIHNATEVLSCLLPADSRALVAVEMIRRQAAQLTRLVDDLLDIGRITQGRIRLQLEPLELATVMAQAFETIAPLLQQKRHKVSVISSYEPLYVNGDFVRLVQCVANILSNAVKYTDPTGEIQVRLRAEESSAVIEISDNGLGIAPDLLPRVFDIFVQGEGSIDRAQGGLGVGLAIVKRLVEQHGGTVAVRSPGTGQGSTFAIRLPRIPRPQALATQEPPVKAAPRRVLIVDDNADAANSLAMLLGLHGHETRVAFSGQEALERIESFQPDVVLLDIGLPETNGYALAARLRSLPKLQGVRLVALTGYGQAEDQLRALAAGFDAHVVKPVDLSALERALAGG